MSSGSKVKGRALVAAASPVYEVFPAFVPILDRFSLVLSAVRIFLSGDVTVSAAAGSCGNRRRCAGVCVCVSEG